MNDSVYLYSKSGRFIKFPFRSWKVLWEFLNKTCCFDDKTYKKGLPDDFINNKIDETEALYIANILDVYIEHYNDDINKNSYNVKIEDIKLFADFVRKSEGFAVA